VQRLASRRVTRVSARRPKPFHLRDVSMTGITAILAGKRTFVSVVQSALSLSSPRGLHALNLVKQERTSNFLHDLFVYFFEV